MTTEPSQHLLVRYLLLTLGWLATVLGVIGIFLPVLPTTPFLLLAAACFLRSSTRLYNRLVSHPRLGPYVEGYLNGKGIPLRAKVYSLVLMWPSLLFSGYIILDSQAVRILFPLIGIAVSLYIWRMPTLERNLPTDRA